MKFFITKCVNFFLITLSVLTYNVDAFNCSDLKLICATRWGIEITPSPPLLCTALALTRFDPVLIADMKKIKGNLPLMVVDDRYLLWHWAIVFVSPVADYMKDFVELGVDIIAMDIINFEESPVYNDPQFTANMIKFIDCVKKDYPKILIGIAFAIHEDPTQSSIDVKAINSHIDFYLLKFIVYKHCEPVKNQRDMVYAASKDDIMLTVTLFRFCGMDTSKLIYTIDLRIFSYKKKPVLADSFEDLAYSQLCSEKVSEHRKFCYNSIPDLFDKAQLCVKEKLLGIYIDNIDYDDYNGSCNCAGTDGAPIKFKGITVIAGAGFDDKAVIESFNCSTAYPVFNNP